MTTRGQINSNFYQTVNVDADGNPISIKSTLIPVAGSNSQIQFNNNSSFGASANLTFDTSTNTLSATHFSGNGSGITNISATNIVGNVANANHATSANTANTANTVTTAAQPNITSVGTLSSLHSTGNITAPFFIGNVVGNISGNLVVPGANTSVLYNQEGSAGASDAFQFDYDANVLTVIGDVVATNFSGTGAGLNNLNGANISEVANAAFATDAGVAYSVDGANVSGAVGLATYASTANSVAGANVSGDVSGANHANIADSANSVAAGNISGTINYATYAGTANAVAGANVSGAVTSANYASYAGNVTIASQGNITSVGNLTTLTVNDGNVRRPTIQVTPAGNIVGLAGGNLAMITINDYGSQSSNVQSENITFIKSRGNATTPLPAANSDHIMRLQTHVYNGNTYPRAGGLVFTATQAANANFQYSNVAWTPGQMTVILGHPYGNAQSTTGSAYTQYIFTPTGQIAVITPTNNGGNTSVPNPGYFAYSCGANTDGSGSGAVNGFLRNRGTYLIPTAVQNNDVIGQLIFAPYNGSGYTTCGAITAKVNTTYGSIVSGGKVPTDMTIQTTNNTTSFIYTFDGAGNLTIPGVYNGDGGGLSNIAAANISGLGNIATINLDGDASNVLKGDGTWGVGGGSGTPGGSNTQVQFNNAGSFGGSPGVKYDSSINELSLNNDGNSNPAFAINGSNTGFPCEFTARNTYYHGIYDNWGHTGAPTFSFWTYENTTDYINPYTFFRARGTESSPLPIQPSDTITSQSFLAYGDAGNSYIQTASMTVQAISNDGAGNVPVDTRFDSFNTASRLTINYPTITMDGNVTANNVSVNSGGFIKYAAFASTDLTAITGSIGQMASVSNNGGKLAYWDTDNSRWSYVFDNSAV